MALSNDSQTKAVAAVAKLQTALGQLQSLLDQYAIGDVGADAERLRGMCLAISGTIDALNAILAG